MRGMWTVARHTLSQCLRMKIAVAFIVILAVTLLGMPSLIKGDGTLAGRIRTFLLYSTTMTAFLLGLVTVLLSVSVIASDISRKQIFSIATKPVSRWHYVIGRWLGVTMLSGILLAIAMASIYSLAIYLRGQEAIGYEDRRAVETEVFAARRVVSPEPINVDQEVATRLAELKNEGQYAKALEAYLMPAGGDEQAAVRMLEDEVRRQFMEQRQSAAPGRGLSWKFTGVNVGGRVFSGGATCLGIDTQNNAGYFRAGEDVIGRLMYGAPVIVDDIEGMVGHIEDDWFGVQFRDGDAKRVELFKPDKPVRLRIEPIVQLVYQLNSAADVTGDKLDSYWIVGNPTTREAYYDFRSDSTVYASTFIIPARMVDEQGNTDVAYVNRSQVSISAPIEAMSIRYPVGSFEANFFRAGLLMMMLMMFLAAIGVLSATFLSLPVAVLTSLGILPFALMRGFLLDALRQAGFEKVDAITWLGKVIMKVTSVLLPDLAQTSPGDALVDGIYISWTTVGLAAAASVLVRTALVLLLASWIFRSRELARVQV